MKITQNVRDYAAGLGAAGLGTAGINTTQAADGDEVTPQSGELTDDKHRIKQVQTELVGKVGTGTAEEVNRGMKEMKQKYHQEGRQLYKEV